MNAPRVLLEYKAFALAGRTHRKAAARAIWRAIMRMAKRVSLWVF